MEKPLTEITDEEWIRYKWLDVTPMSRPNERVFLEVGVRSPSEAAQAAREIASLRPAKAASPPDDSAALGYCGP